MSYNKSHNLVRAEPGQSQDSLTLFDIKKTVALLWHLLIKKTCVIDLRVQDRMDILHSTQIQSVKRKFTLKFTTHFNSLPGPHLSGLCEGERELGTTQNLTDTLSFEFLYYMGYTAALTPTSPQLSKVSISPRPNATVAGEREGLGVTASTGNVYCMLI